MGESGPVPGKHPLPPTSGSQPALPSYPSQRQHYPNLRQQLELCLEVRPATIQLLPGGPVLRRRAARGSSDVTIGQHQFVGS
jgi:hypothetical protein